MPFAFEANVPEEFSGALHAGVSFASEARVAVAVLHTILHVHVVSLLTTTVRVLHIHVISFATDAGSAARVGLVKTHKPLKPIKLIIINITIITPY